MAELPILPISTDAFLADTSHMSAEAIGAYTRIILVMWRHGGRLPDSDQELARIAGVSIGAWRARLCEVVRRCLTSAGGYVSQKRLTSTWLAVRERRRVAAANGSRGGQVTQQHRRDAAAWSAGWRQEDLDLIQSGGGWSGDSEGGGSTPLTHCDSSNGLKQPLEQTDQQNRRNPKPNTESSLGGSQSASSMARPVEPLGRAQTEKKPPAGSLATARDGRALARPPGAECGAVQEARKPPHLTSRAELEAAFASRRGASTG